MIESLSDNEGASSGKTMLGLVLLIGGILIALYAHQNMAEFETTAGQLGRALSDEAQREYQTYSNMRIGGAVAAAIGAVLSISGD